jgi:hypothetical protein
MTRTQAGDFVRRPEVYSGIGTESQVETLNSTCRYLGRTFNEGDTICDQGREYRCAGGSWVETGNSC